MSITSSTTHPKVDWQQDTRDVSITLSFDDNIILAKDIHVHITSTTCEVRWRNGPANQDLDASQDGSRLRGTLRHPVIATDALWSLTDDSHVTILLPKQDPDTPWPSLFHDGRYAKTPREALAEYIRCEAPLPPVDDLDEASKSLFYDLVDRQEALACGDISLREGFDDFRVVYDTSSWSGSEDPVM